MDARANPLGLRIRGGDELAFDEFTEWMWPETAQYCRKKLRSREDGEEVAQDAYVKLWRHGAKWNPEGGPFLSWWYRIVLNCLIDRVRLRDRRSHLNLPMLEEEEDGFIPMMVLHVDRAPHPLEWLLAKELEAWMRASTGQFNRKGRAVFLACELDGVTFDQLEASGANRSTVKVRHLRGRLDFAARLTRLGIEHA